MAFNWLSSSFSASSSSCSLLRRASSSAFSFSAAVNTTRGTLIVRGEGLHLQLLRLDGGEVLVDGTVDALTYEDSQPAGSFLARLFG